MLTHHRAAIADDDRASSPAKPCGIPHCARLDVELIVITIGTTASRATAQTVSFKLTPPSLEKGLTENKEPPHKALAKAIVAASRELQAALRNHKNLELHDLSASIKFEVSRTPVSGEIGIDIGSVTIGASHAKTKGFAHTITLNYAKDDKS